MKKTKISVLYFSQSGNTRQMAKHIARGAQEMEDVEVKVMSLAEIDEAFLCESSCVILGTPTYYASMASEVKSWLDKNSGSYQLDNKLGGAFATQAYVHGGGDLAVQGILTHMMVSGMLVYSGGCACGNPTIHLGPVAMADSLQQYENTFQIYGMRMARKAEELRANLLT